MTEIEQKYLPTEILKKATLSGKEFGWKRKDFKEVLDLAVKIGLGILGGQVQFKLPDGTCELYWHNYDTGERITGESWKDYCNRTKSECIIQFEKLPTDIDLVNEGIKSFDFLKSKNENGLDLHDSLIFVIYFIESNTEQK